MTQATYLYNLGKRVMWKVHKDVDCFMLTSSGDNMPEKIPGETDHVYALSWHLAMAITFLIWQVPEHRSAAMVLVKGRTRNIPPTKDALE